jgi:hypothetical protein
MNGAIPLVVFERSFIRIGAQKKRCKPVSFKEALNQLATSGIKTNPWLGDVAYSIK